MCFFGSCGLVRCRLVMRAIAAVVTDDGLAVRAWRRRGEAARSRALIDPKVVCSPSRASSSTRNLHSSSESTPRSIKSVSRPGVATTIETPPASFSSCGPAFAPPYSAEHQRRAPPGGGGASHVSLAHSSSICDASSRVGARMSAAGRAGCGPSRSAASPASAPTSAAATTSAISGSRNATVLPEPVCAVAITSWPASASGTCRARERVSGRRAAVSRQAARVPRGRDGTARGVPLLSSRRRLARRARRARRARASGGGGACG